MYIVANKKCKGMRKNIIRQRVITVIILSSFVALSLVTKGCRKDDNNSAVWLQVATNTIYAVAIKTDGTLWAWGQGPLEQKLNRDSPNSYPPKSIPFPTQIGIDADWKQVACGSSHNVAIKTDGTLWAWGWNRNGELGLKDRDEHLSPVQVGTNTNWGQVACGASHNAAIKTDGTLWAWGVNSAGVLGLEDKITCTLPTQIGRDTNWQKVACGFIHTLAIKTDGTLWSWGGNGYGQLGLGASDNSPHPAPIQIGTETNWQQVAGGQWYTLAVKTNGTLWAWGDNKCGQLGIGNTLACNLPTRVGIYTNWLEVACSREHTLAIKTDGTLWGWGNDENYQLGVEYKKYHLTPAQVGKDINWKQVAAGASYTLVIKTDNTMWGWGNNYYGQLGLGIINDYDLHHDPTKVKTIR